MNLAKRVILIAKLIQLKEDFIIDDILKASSSKINRIINSKIRFKDLSYLQILEDIFKYKRSFKTFNLEIIFDNLLREYMKFEKITKRSKKYKEYIELWIKILKKYEDKEERRKIREAKKKKEENRKYIVKLNIYSKAIKATRKKYNPTSTNVFAGIPNAILNNLYDYNLVQLEDFNRIIEISDLIHYIQNCIEFMRNKNGSELSMEEKDLIRANNRLNRADLEVQLINQLNDIWKLIEANNILEDKEKIAYLNSNFKLKDNFKLRLKISLLKKEYMKRRENIDRGSEEVQLGLEESRAIFDLTSEISLDLKDKFNIFKIYCNKKKYNKFLNIIYNSSDFNYISSGINKARALLMNKRSHFIIYSANKRVPKRKFDNIIELYNLRRSTEEWSDPLIDIDFNVKYVGDLKRIYNSVARFNNLIKILGASGIYKDKVDRYNLNRPLKRISLLSRQFNRNFYKNLEIISSSHSNIVPQEGKINRGEQKLIDLFNATQLFTIRGDKIGIFDFMIKLIKDKDYRNSYFNKFEDFFVPYNHYSLIPYSLIRRIKERYCMEIIGNMINFREYIYDLKKVLPAYIKYMITRYEKELRILRMKLEIKETKRNKIIEEAEIIKYIKPYKRINDQITRIFRDIYSIEDKIDFWNSFNQIYEDKTVRYLREYIYDNWNKIFVFLKEIIDKKIRSDERYRRINSKRKFSSCIKLGVLFGRLENLNIKLGADLKAGDALSYFRELDMIKTKKRSYGALPIMKMIVDICINSNLNGFLKEIFFLLGLRRYINEENKLIF